MLTWSHYDKKRKLFRFGIKPGFECLYYMSVGICKPNMLIAKYTKISLKTPFSDIQN